ncbi:uncharacterized protein LOC142229357 [Haematobia irritans]|uniref:uncharacterized protein LOC142229357 n=1 Tax=Haematobia irritans TaxID=7368 RepID=UPI003F504191
MAFGQHMVTNGSTYRLLRNLGMLGDRAVSFGRSDSFDIVPAKASEFMRKQNERNERAYNLRSRQVSYEVGQEGFSAKLAPTFIKARVRERLGNSYYELEDLQGRSLGKYHAKDIRQ